MRTRLFALVTFMFALATVAQASTNDLTGLLQKGLFDEEANRDLNAAISDYQTLATDFDKDRQLAATAIFRLGECYRKLGRTNDAVVQYQRIVRDFSDQPTLVNLSRQNLAGLGSPGNPSAAQQNAAISEPARELQWVKKLQAMPLSDVLQTAPTVLTDATLINLVYQYNQTELDLIRLRTDHGPDYPDVKKTQAIQDALQAKIKERLDGLSRALSMELGASATASSGGQGTQESGVTDDEQKQIRTVQAIIQNSPDLINASYMNNETLLQYAAGRGQLVVAKYLLDHGADVDARGHNTIATPLYDAASNGHKSIVELLLAHGANVDGAGGPDPLNAAASKGFREVVDVLLANKANVNASGVLRAAVSNGDTNLIQSLIEHGADVNAADFGGGTPLHLAAQAGNTAAIKILLDAKANVEVRDKNGDTPLALAARDGKVEAVSLLLDSGASVDATNNRNDTPLLNAAWQGHADVTRELLEHHGDPNHQDSDGYTPLIANMRRPEYSVEFIRELLEHKADPNQASVGTTPLQSAIAKPDADAVQLLLQHGADPNGPAGAAEPPLCQAVDYNAGSRIVGLLLDKGADPNARNKDGYVPLMRTSDPEIIRELIAHKADVNARGTYGVTPLIYQVAYQQDSSESLKALLADGANPDLQDNNGDTALHAAVSYGETNTVRILLEHKANPNIQDNAGATPLDLANKMTSSGPNGTVVFRQNRPITITKETRSMLIDMLTQAGGLANLPRRDRIEVRRADSYQQDIFSKGTNDWNHFSLLELIAAQYHLITPSESEDENAMFPRVLSGFSVHNPPIFPDFKNIIIYRRTNNNTKQTAIPVDVDAILNSGDCSRDVLLDWGDVIEIPETDHPVGQSWPGLSDATMKTLANCLARQVTINIKGESTVVKLTPALRSSPPSFMLRSVLDNSKLIRVSSDLAHVKVTRHDPKTHKTMEWIVDCNSPKDDLWLRDGDVIDVPER